MPLRLICQSFPGNLPDKKKDIETIPWKTRSIFIFDLRYIKMKKKKMNEKAQRTSEFFDASQRVIRLYFHGI